MPTQWARRYFNGSFRFAAGSHREYEGQESLTPVMAAVPIDLTRKGPVPAQGPGLSTSRSRPPWTAPGPIAIESAAARPGIGLGLPVPCPPVLGLGEHRLTRMYPASVGKVTLVVGVAHHCADVPTDLPDETGPESPKASHCCCTSFSSGVANR